jgi:DNA-binding NarL/FixJ family response regulator
MRGAGASDAETQPRELPIAILVLATVSALETYGTISGMRPTVLIVDDHAAFRGSARALLQAEGFDVIGEAANGAAAVEAVAVLRPEIVLLDIQLPDLDGLAVAEQLAAAPDPPAVVLISSRDAAAYGPRLQATPARGFIPKRGLSGEALAALVG